MKKLLVLFAAMAVTNAMPVNAAVIELFEGGVNIDGSVQIFPAVPPEVNTSLFDFTTGIGTISYTITGAGSHYASLYVDHQIDDLINGFFNEYGATTGTPAAGQTWEIDDPFLGDIFTNFVGSDLDGLNGVPQGSEDDVAMALAWDFTLGAGETATVDFLVGLQEPAGGFFLSLTDPDSDLTGETIFLSSTLDIGITPVPVPGALLLFGSGLVGLMGMRFRRRSQRAEV